MLQQDGYYETATGQHVMIVEDFVADRATGELLKIGHVITLAMSDGQLASLGATNNGLITLGGPAPDARDDSATTTAGEGIVIDVLANDSDPDGGALRIDGLTDAGHGEIAYAADGTLVYQPNAGFTGTDTFHYWAADEEGNFSRAEVSIEVLADTGF